MMSVVMQRVSNHAQLRAWGLVAVCALALACEAQSNERAQEAVDEAVDKAGQELAEARAESHKVMDEAVDKAGQGMAQAREGLAVARDEVDERLAAAKQSLGGGMDDAAVAFEELAEVSQDKASDLGEKLGEVKARSRGLVVSPGAIDCEEDPARRVCRIDRELLAELAAEPRLLVREVSLRPKDGAAGSGLELARTEAEGFASSLGLRKGDILLELNGAKLGSFAAIRALDEALSGKPEAKLIYERDGERHELTLIQQGK